MTSASPSGAGASRNVALYPWFKALQNLLFWQAVWFLFFQAHLSAAEAVLLYATYDVATTLLEVPSGYMSDRLGRRVTLVASALAGLAGAVLIGLGSGFWAFALGQILIGTGIAFASGTDSALLYESLAAEGRADAVEAEELKAWRFSFAALALSAVTGGAMGAGALPFLAAALAQAGAVILALRFTEPPRGREDFAEGEELLRLGSLRAAFRQPVVLWIFALSVLMYGFSHIPFVFGQPFILEALTSSGLSAEAPLVSGAVTTVMMLISLVASAWAPRLRRRIGLGAMLLTAFGMQIALCATLALTNGMAAIALLFLRMVPNALSRPFIVARVQPLLGSEGRATYFSLQSLVGRLLFAATLWLASHGTSGSGQMAYAEIQTILGWYVAGGLLCLGALALAARRVRIAAEG
ncbi:MFS transporter [Acidimangrovimonas pyrenivorans]|uniref:MFS transporter n=1 Tax=Acidimangrovimonas pyrenivorans TaxID=2030798 RepID=A0ABV7AKP6_9RHOB